MQRASKTSQGFLQHSLRLYIAPRPETLVERRHIHRHLQQYGEILHFKSNFYDRTVYSPDTALLIYRDKQSYDRLLVESPVTIKVERKPFDPISLHWTYPSNGPRKGPLDLDFEEMELEEQKLRKPEHNFTPFVPLDLAPVETLEEKTLREQRQMDKHLAERVLPQLIEFKITVTPFEGNQRNYLEHTPYWGSFKLRNSMMYQQLRKTVPLKGLADIDVFKRAPPLPVTHRLRNQLAQGPTLRQRYDQAVAVSKRKDG